MRIKPKQIEIPEDNPLLYDALNRKQYVEALCDLLDNIEESLVISINGKWGSGKSTFLLMLQASIRKQGFKTIFFNAWQNDYFDDPRAALVSEINKLIPKSVDVKKKFLEASINLLKIGVPVVVKALSVGLIDSKGVNDTIATIASEFADKQLNQYVEIRESIDKFKRELGNVVRKLRKKNTKIVIFIDDLDRCRPKYALQVLEVAKHLFDIEGITFILGSDEGQLKTSIASEYGITTDTSGYLRKFIDIAFDLPEPDFSQFIDNLYTTLEYESYFMPRKKYNENQNDFGNFKIVLKGLSKIYHLSLRDLEKCFIRISLICLSTPENQILYTPVLAFLIVLSLMDRSFYKKVVQKQTNFEGIIQYFGQIEGGNEFLFEEEQYAGLTLLSFLVTAIHDSSKGGSAYDYIQKCIDDTSTAQIIKDSYLRIVRSAKQIRFGSSFDNLLGFLDKKIAFAEKIIKK